MTERIIKNKHTDVIEDLELSQHFSPDLQTALGEVIILNRLEKPGIAIKDINGKVRIIGEGYGDESGVTDIVKRLGEVENTVSGQQELVEGAVLAAGNAEGIANEANETSKTAKSSADAASASATDAKNMAKQAEDDATSALKLVSGAVTGVYETAYKEEPMVKVGLELKEVSAGKAIAATATTRTASVSTAAEGNDGLATALDVQRELGSAKEELLGKTVNGARIGDNPVLEGNDIKVGSAYSTSEDRPLGVSDSIMEALGKLEGTLNAHGKIFSGSMNEMNARLCPKASAPEEVQGTPGTYKLKPYQYNRMGTVSAPFNAILDTLSFTDEFILPYTIEFTTGPEWGEIPASGAIICAGVKWDAGSPSVKAGKTYRARIEAGLGELREW